MSTTVPPLPQYNPNNPAIYPIHLHPQAINPVPQAKGIVPANAAPAPQGVKATQISGNTITFSLSLPTQKTELAFDEIQVGDKLGPETTPSKFTVCFKCGIFNYGNTTVFQCIFFDSSDGGVFFRTISNMNDLGWIIKERGAPAKETQKAGCSCEILTLMVRGCSCGHLVRKYS